MKLRWFISFAFLVVLIGISGCRQASEPPPDTFTATYTLDDGRNYSISGRSNAMPGEQSKYLLKINSRDVRWQDDYYILLIDSDSILQEIKHGEFDIPANGGIQEPVNVKFPDDFTGALGLCVAIPQHGYLISTLSIGVQNAVATGWPDITHLIQPAATGN